MKESMKKLMHNVELLIVTTGKGNWMGASESVSKSKRLLTEIEREIHSEMKAESEESRKRRSRTVSIN